jgi:hypothetical protein
MRSHEAPMATIIATIRATAAIGRRYVAAAIDLP